MAQFLLLRMLGFSIILAVFSYEYNWSKHLIFLILCLYLTFDSYVIEHDRNNPKRTVTEFICTFIGLEVVYGILEVLICK